MLRRLLSVFSNPSPGPSSLVDPENRSPPLGRMDDPEWDLFRASFPPGRHGKIKIELWLDRLHSWAIGGPEHQAILLHELSRLTVRAIWHCKSADGGKKSVVENRNEYVMVEFEDSSSKTGVPIYLRYDRFYDPCPPGALASGPMAHSNESLASTSVSITKNDLAYLFHAKTQAGDMGAEDLLPKQAMRKIIFPSTKRPGLLDIVSVLVAHSTLAPYYKGWTTMCLWYAGSTTDILKDTHGGIEETVNRNLWESAGKVKVLSLRKAVYKPYESTENELQAAVNEIESGGKELEKGKKAVGIDPSSVKEVVRNLKSLSKEILMARAAALKEEAKTQLGYSD